MLTSWLLAVAALAAETTIVSPTGASPLERFAAREVRRYFYLRTGKLLPVATSDSVPAGGAIVVSRRDRALARPFAAAVSGPEQYRLATTGKNAFIVGADDIGTLYGAYRFAEILGVRFYLHGDVVPDARIAPEVPQLNETGKPLFDTRGIQPFHDFPEGPDWWNRDDYLAYIGQLPKLRMNFFGLHTYPEGNVGPEPAVWIGQPGDILPEGEVRFSYPSRWANTARQLTWGYAAMNTAEFCAGAGQLFESDVYGPEVMSDLMPSPATAAASNLLFRRTAELYGRVFATAHRLGVKTCIGTETPLTIPKLVQERLKAQGRDPKDPAVVREIYTGMFQRIAGAYPVDYYWLWTPENWTWEGNKEEELKATIADIQAALDALAGLEKPFRLATSGWVLGPAHDRAALDKFLPKDSPMSCINRKVGHAPDEPGFANISGRPKWVIPWMENDPNLIAPQPWAGRMRYDAADALRLRCTGLLGIHWRTKILAPNVAALAGAAWDQSWVPASFDRTPVAPGSVPPDRAADGESHTHPQKDRAMPVRDLYDDFARAQFGESVAARAGEILTGIDGVNLPEPSSWQDGPGGVVVEKAPWSEVKRKYEFVDELAGLRPQVHGAGNLARFDYWLNTYRYMAAMAEAGCLRGELDRAMAALASGSDAAARKTLAERALGIRTELARAWERMISLQVAAADTPGELGTLANLEQHSRGKLNFLTAHDAKLAEALGAPLPAAVQLRKAYTGPARLVVPTVRTTAAKNEILEIKVIALDRQPVGEGALYWRPLGAGRFTRIPLKHLGRAVYTAALPVTSDLEYYVQAKTAGGQTLAWPPTAPALNQTVVTEP
ncbi:MAG TPA: hypothetical protein VHA11_05605 [Bryobacteraceae bacterium]|nr:hypothetical protein [Bryobacteraceae bacterium]